MKKMDDVSCTTRIYKHIQFTFDNVKKIFYIHYNKRCHQHYNVGSCVFYITALNYEILNHVHVVC